MNKRRSFPFAAVAVIVALCIIFAAILTPMILYIRDGNVSSSAGEADGTETGSGSTETDSGTESETKTETEEVTYASLLIDALNGILEDSTGITTAADAISATEENGYKVTNLSLAEGDVMYDQTSCRFLIVNDGAIVYSDEATSSDVINTPCALWKIAHSSADISGSYSIYYASDYKDTISGKIIDKGIDVSDYAAAVDITYTDANGTADTIIINGNGGTLTAETANGAAASDDIYLYGSFTTVTATEVASSSLHIYGTVEKSVTLVKGHVEVHEGAEVRAIIVTAASASDVSVTNSSESEIIVASTTIATSELDVTGTVTTTTVSESDVDSLVTELLSFAGGAGTESSPYLIENAEQFANITAGSEENIKYYKLTADIDLSTVTKLYGAYELCYAVVDGDDHLVYASETTAIYGVFCYAYGTATVKNLVYDLTNFDLEEIGCADCVGLIYEVTEASVSSPSTNLTIDSVTVKGTHSVDGNNAAFVFREFILEGSTISFKNCDMAANFSGDNKYNACFVGWQGVWLGSDGKALSVNYGHISFTGCTVSGTLVCPMAGMYTANASNAYTRTYSFTNNTITGSIRGTEKANLFCGNGTDTTGTIYTAAVAGTTYTEANLFVGATDTTLAITAADDGTLTITASDNSEVSYYVVKLSYYTRAYDENGVDHGTVTYTVSQTIYVNQDSSLNVSLVNGGFVDESYCIANEIETDTDSLGNTIAVIDSKTYYVIADYLYYDANGTYTCYVGSPDAGGKASKASIIIVSAYLENGTLYSSASL